MDPNTPPLPGSNQPSKTSGLAITSLVLGILSLMTCFLGFITGIPGVICGHISLSKIKRSAGALGGRGVAIAGLITGYAGIAFFLLLVPFAIPNFMKAREAAQRISCIVNLQVIENAKEQWARENKKQDTDVPTEKDLAPYLPKGMPKCIAGGAYSINAVNTKPTCSIPGHKLGE